MSAKSFDTLPAPMHLFLPPRCYLARLQKDIDDDLEVCRLMSNNLLSPPARKAAAASRPSAACMSPTRSLSPAENVPCPFGNRPECELYPARLRRPSSLYGAGANAASSRPPSRQVSMSPSNFGDEAAAGSHVGTKSPIAEDQECWEYEECDELDVEAATGCRLSAAEPTRYARPDSFVIPIGGVWNPKDDDSGPSWSTLENHVDTAVDARKEGQLQQDDDETEGVLIVSDPVAPTLHRLLPLPPLALLPFHGHLDVLNNSPLI